MPEDIPSLKRIVFSIWVYMSLTLLYSKNMRRVDEKLVRQAVHTIHLFLDHNHNIHNHNFGESQQRRESVENDLWKFYHPDTVLEDYYVYKAQSAGDTQRLHIQSHFFDSQPFHETIGNRALEGHFDLTKSQFTSTINVANMKTRTALFESLGLFEQYYHFPLPESIFDKDVVVRYFQAHLQKLQQDGKSEQCLIDSQFQKPSYLLDDPQQCKQFFDLAIPMYEHSGEGEVYKFVKKNRFHNQEGTEIASRQVFHHIAQMYDYGRRCDQSEKHRLFMQEYIDNPLLIDGRKNDIRLYIMMTSTYPQTFLFYKKLYLMKCAYRYDYKVFRNQSHICVTGYNRKQYARVSGSEEYEEMLPMSQMNEGVTFEEYARRLMDEGKIDSLSWVEEKLIPDLEKKFYHFFEGYIEQEGAINDPRVGEYSACDLNIDSNLNIYLLECTTNPNMTPFERGGVMDLFLQQLHKDAYVWQQDAVRRKYKRIKNLIEIELKPRLRYYSKENLYNKHREELWPIIEKALMNEKAEPVNDAWHLADFDRAKQSCI